MATTVVAQVDERFVLHDISWDTYERLLADHADRRSPRFAYDRGMLEIMSPGRSHERDSQALGSIVWTVAIELGLNFDDVGSMTYRRRSIERGFEADGSFYLLDPDRTELAEEDEIDGNVDPPPDLVIEIDYSRSSIPKLDLFAALLVPEVWRWDGDRATFYHLTGNRYEEAATSCMLPILSPSVVADFVKANLSMTKAAWQRSILDWMRTR